MNKAIRHEIESEIDQILMILPTEQALIMAIRYAGGLDSIKGPLADARERIDGLRTKIRAAE